MCGVIGLVYEHARSDLGRVAGELLCTLEYRGYDSTGAAIQGAGEEVVLKKGVGAPSKMVHDLGIVELSGQLLCGQVRWATFGAVTDVNSQPHVVRCHAYLYGAHNGNVTNCDPQKAWLVGEGHQVLSDNDGEMVVHTVEHEFARELRALPDGEREAAATRRAAMRRAIVRAATRLEGSYAAVIVDPVTRCQWAMKQGSSLYFGVGGEAGPEGRSTGGRFAIASSDLSSVLKLTRTVVPMREGELVEFDATSHRLYALRDTTLPTTEGGRAVRAGSPIERAPVRTRLRAEDTALAPPFTTFMAQEIAAQVATCREVVALFGDVPGVGVPVAAGAAAATTGGVGDGRVTPADVTEFGADVARFLDLADATRARGGRLLVVCCGSSYNAARAGALFFNDLAHEELVPLLPGEYRERLSHALRDGDLLVAVSQSGETKDLIDVMNDAIASGRDVRRVALVNNVNSTLALEKADLVLPLRCGPEVAVPATKSFVNQLAVFFGLGLAVAARRVAALPAGAPGRAAWAADLDLRRARFAALPSLIAATVDATDRAVEEAAELLHLRPSLHLLAIRLTALAREGALKIREVVLNHAEGFEGSEFKHGPNTLLGINTVFGPAQVDLLLARLGALQSRLVREAADVDAAARLVEAAARAALSRDPAAAAAGLTDGERRLLDATLAGDPLFSSLYADYPLVYLTGPDERDVNLTISQINTHKIRGAETIVLAEEHALLRAAAEKPPADNPRYRSVYVALPRTDDTLLTMFSATVALQRLALAMSLKKMRYLDRLGVRDHGVHPDAPKNVSKSITVD